MVTYEAIVHQAEEGGFWAEIPSLPGCLSQGETWDEIVANITEAAQGWLEAAKLQATSDPHAKIIRIAV